jgi:hypothetical protein
MSKDTVRYPAKFELAKLVHVPLRAAKRRRRDEQVPNNLTKIINDRKLLRLPKSRNVQF